jgi:hypothetical protein
MKHSGLQKSISSIFDGAEPIKQETAPAIGTAAPQKPADAAPLVSRQAAPAVTIPVAVSASPLAAATVQTPPKAAVQTAAHRPATRPQPVPKNNTSGHNTVSIKDLWKTIKTRLTGGSKESLDPRQKKTLILGISLAMVFAAVLMFVLGSGPSGAKAASKKAGKEAVSVTGVQSGSIDSWQKPEIYPLSLRDPMKPSSDSKDSPDDGDMTVRGIVYSSVNPSAIIANQIVYEGDVIVGVKIIKIGKDFVVFEKDGKRWQQQVRQ